MVRCLAVVLLLASGPAWADAFGGFSADGGKYLVGRNRVCAPLAVGKDGEAMGMPACSVVDDRKAREDMGFHKPERARTTADGRPLRAEITGGRTLSLLSGDAVLARWSGDGLNLVRGLYVEGRIVAVEYGTSDGQSDAIAFALGPAPAPARPPAAASQPVRPPADTAYERALGKGGVWEQHQVPCEDAGVTLTLQKAMKFAIRIETKCQGHKDVTKLAGSWVAEGGDSVVLRFDNEDGTVETMTCRFATCPDEPEDCLTCAQDDVSFTLQVVKR